MTSKKLAVLLICLTITFAMYATANDDLIDAAKAGNLAGVQTALSNGADVHTYNDWALDIATEYGHFAIVELLLNRGADIHARNDCALNLAAEQGHLAVVELLLNRGANIHANDDDALRFAALYGNLNVVELLLNHSANIHANDDLALRWAAARGHLAVVKLLLNHGANIHADNDGALRCAATRRHLDVVEFLLNHKASIHANNDESLVCAAKNGHLEIVNVLLDRGADIHADGDNALRIAIRYGQLSTAARLCARGAIIHKNIVPNTENDFAPSVSLTACASFRLFFTTATTNECQQYLREHEILRTGTPEEKSEVATHGLLAGLIREDEDAAQRDFECAQMILQDPAAVAPAAREQAQAILDGTLRRPWYHRPINHRFGPNKQTPLMWAALFGFTDDIEILRDHGARVDLSDANGENAITLASMADNWHIAGALTASLATRMKIGCRE